jgi:hypothetical protein
MVLGCLAVFKGDNFAIKGALIRALVSRYNHDDHDYPTKIFLSYNGYNQA